MKNDDFSYSFYKNLLSKLIKNNYTVCSYFDNFEGKQCILRHDIDFDIEKSLVMARIEKELGVKSTYFVLLKTDFYNPFSKKSIDMLKEIIFLGHDVGLHFDEKSYDENIDVVEMIKREATILGSALDYDIRVVSMHRPSNKTLEANYKIEGIINSYSEKYFKDYKYVSDSRRNWRENVIEIIDSNKYDKLHILTHSFWYNDKSKDLTESLTTFVNNAKKERYSSLKCNFSNIDEVFKDFKEE